MPPSPTSSISSLAAKFAFKPAEAARIVTASTAAAQQSNNATSSSSPSRTAKRRLSGTAATPAKDLQSSVRSSPRRNATTAASNLDVKGKGKQATTATTTSTNNTSSSTSVDLHDETDLDWEIADEDIAAISDEVLVSNSNKKIKLDDVLSSSPSVAATSKVAPVKANVEKAQIKSVPKLPSAKSTTPALQSLSAESQLSDIAKDFLDGLSDSPSAGTGGMLSHRQLLELESRTMDPSWLKELRKE